MALGRRRGQTCCPTRRRASPPPTAQSPLPLSKTTILPLSSIQSFRSQCWAQIYRSNKIDSFQTNSQALNSNKALNLQKFLFPHRVVKTSPSPVSCTSFRRNGGDMSVTEMSGRLNVQRCGSVLHRRLSFSSPLIPPTSQARIALLEGERRSFDNVKLDLMRRIKMLEYALRVERCTISLSYHRTSSLTCRLLAQNSSINHPLNLYLPQNCPQSSLRLARLVKKRTRTVTRKAVVAVLPGVKVCVSRKKNHLNTENSYINQDSPLPPETRLSVGSIQNGSSAAGTSSKPPAWSAPWSGLNGPPGTSAATLGKPPPGRDPKSRARSRDYLKQCVYCKSVYMSRAAFNHVSDACRKFRT